MVWFTITNPDSHKWEMEDNKKGLRDVFIEDLKDMEEKARKIEKDIYEGNFISDDIEVRKKAEENLSSALAMAIYEKEMITKTAVHNLSNMDEKLNREIELIEKKIRYFNEFVFENAQKAAEMAWDKFSIEKQSIEVEIQKMDEETNKKLMNETDENEKRKIFGNNEQMKAEKYALLDNIRVQQINTYINSLINSGVKKIQEAIFSKTVQNKDS